MPSKTAADTVKLATSAYWLWAESCFVIWHRSWMIMAGSPGAKAEAERMVTEKVQASSELMTKALTGSLGTGMGAVQRSVDHLGTAVSANRRRLAQPRTALPRRTGKAAT